MSEHKTFVAKDLSDWMIRNKWSDTALARRLQVTRQAIAHWRKGLRQPYLEREILSLMATTERGPEKNKKGMKQNGN